MKLNKPKGPEKRDPKFDDKKPMPPNAVESVIENVKQKVRDVHK
ncbi:hypothetical protein ACSLBF_16820 [Pseudoalteromonas sp. T1lg65]